MAFQNAVELEILKKKRKQRARYKKFLNSLERRRWQRHALSILRPDNVNAYEED